MKKAKVDEKKELLNKKIYKSFLSETEFKGEDDESRLLIAKISDPLPDRSKDRVIQNGVVLDNFVGKNAPVLWAHKYDQKPIGKCVDIKVSKDGILASVEFTPKGLNPEADMIYEMYKQGFLNAWSIGFMPIDYEVNKEGGYDFKSWELFEFSSVPVPDNPRALTVMRSKGINVDEAFENMKGKDLPKDFVVEKETPDDVEEGETEEEKEVTEVTVKIGNTEEVIKTLDEGKTLIERLASENEALKKAAEAKKEADNPSTDLPISGLTIGQLKDLLADAKVGKDVDNSTEHVEKEVKKVEEVVVKDVDEVLVLSDLLSCFSWVIWCFENDSDGDSNQASVDKLNQALGLVLQVVQEQATMGEKSYKLSDLPKGKENIKILAKAGRAISSKHEDMLKSAIDCMTKGAEHVNNVLESVGIDNEPDEDNEKSNDDALEKLANAVSTNNRKTDSVAKKQNETLSMLQIIASEIGGDKK